MQHWHGFVGTGEIVDHVQFANASDAYDWMFNKVRRVEMVVAVFEHHDGSYERHYRDGLIAQISPCGDTCDVAVSK